MELKILHPKIDKYLDSQLPEREAWFYEMEQQARDQEFPAVGPQVGNLLELLARSIGAKRIMELGSGFGYSGLWFARALPQDGYLLLTDFEENNRRLAEENFRKAGKTELMEFQVGDALQLMAQQDKNFDIIFNDVDKEMYPQIIQPAYQLLRPGGLFITDNALWYGRVTESAQDEATEGVLRFNRLLMEHDGFQTALLPLRDGLSIGIKIR